MTTTRDRTMNDSEYKELYEQGTMPWSMAIIFIIIFIGAWPTLFLAIYLGWIY
jgi:hypothetical protein